jgi:exodeoxyribonuclease-3
VRSGQSERNRKRPLTSRVHYHLINEIVSWNINSLRKRQDRLFAWLEATSRTSFVLQETKCTDDQFPALALQAAGYYAAYHGEKSYNGVAILSKMS